jgi:PPOX class probable F420-dependent enzyme
MSAFEDLAGSRYVSLETYKKDGTAVQTPVWVARNGADLVVFSNGDSYKVKRLRRNPKLRIAKCGVRGGLKGPWHEAMGRVVEDEGQKQSAIEAIRSKYGWQMTLVDIGAGIGGSKKNWAVIAIRLAARE